MRVSSGPSSPTCSVARPDGDGVTYHWRVADDVTDDLIEQIADATVRIVNSNLDLVRRVVDRDREIPESGERLGPVQDAWLTWADCAGDLVTISYLTAHLADVVGGFHRPTTPGP